MKITIIHDEPLTKKIKRNYFIDDFISQGFDVEYWGVHKLLYGKLSFVDEIEESYNFNIQSYKELSERLCQNTSDYYIIEYAQTLKGYFINHLLYKYKCRCAYLGIHTSVNLTTKEKILNFRDYGINKVAPFVRQYFQKLLIKLLGIFWPSKKIDIVFYCGQESLKQLSNCPIKIPVNSFDYEDYLKNADLPSIVEHSDYIVFLDEYYAYHPDVLLWGRPVTPEKYYSSLNRFFNYLEKRYQMPVIIAAHPKSDYSDSTFNGRQIVKYETPRLVKNSSLVLGHDSLSLSFPILNYKPLVFIYTNEFSHTGLSTLVWMKKYSSLLKRPLVNIDIENEYEGIDYLNAADKSSYDVYKFRYLTSEASMSLKSGHIICSTFQKYKV